jgi:adenylosuccinate lyase
MTRAHLHVGMTSSDVVDTALALQIRAALQALLSGLSQLRSVVWELADRHRRTAMVGRTHGMHAEPITFGLKCLVWNEALARAEARLAAAGDGCAVGSVRERWERWRISMPRSRARRWRHSACARSPAATQVVQRDRHATLLAALAVLGGTLEGIALEIRHLQRSEVREVAEPFRARQKGSSAMPHKRNPVRCERICGLSRLLRGYAAAGFENQALWHERDISHSSAERVILPDAFLVADFMIAELSDVLGGLRVDAEAMRRNLDAGGGLIHSQRVLLALTAAGLARDDAYRLVQGHALAALDGDGSFRERLAGDAAVTGRWHPGSSPPASISPPRWRASTRSTPAPPRPVPARSTPERRRDRRHRQRSRLHARRGGRSGCGGRPARRPRRHARAR